MSQIPVIAIDGYAGAGKGEMRKRVAKELGFHELDSGTLYRAVGLLCHEKGISSDDTKKAEDVATLLDIEFEGDKIILEGRDRTHDIRSELGSRLAKQFSKIGEVRKALRGFQLDMRKSPGLVADGRDMGFIFDTPHRFFLTADPMVRAKRRVKQLSENGTKADLDIIYKEIIARDEHDKTRLLAPLVPHKDAIIIDTTNLTKEEVVQTILDFYKNSE